MGNPALIPLLFRSGTTYRSPRPGDPLRAGITYLRRLWSCGVIAVFTGNFNLLTIHFRRTRYVSLLRTPNPTLTHTHALCVCVCECVCQSVCVCDDGLVHTLPSCSAKLSERSYLSPLLRHPLGSAVTDTKTVPFIDRPGIL